MSNLGIRTDASGTFGALTLGGVDKLEIGGSYSGHLSGFRNILINGDMRINQRGVTIAAAANGAYGPDRWKKVDASNMTQIVEAGNFEPSTVYTLSGTGVTTQQLTSPASGNWTLPNIPIAATKVQLELGSIATPFENRPIGLELALCQRYCLPFSYGHDFYATVTVQIDRITYKIPEMRATPTVGTLSNSNSVNTTSIVVSPITARSVQLQVQGSGIGNIGATGSCLLTAEL